MGECIALLPEVERWWGTQAPSEHITVVPFIFPGLAPAAATRVRR
ncbi:MAG TPA: hypothetical protein VF761_00070 [Gemmatimonadaceae bacterium]